MPAKNSIKQYAPDSYYHLYNRGVEKRQIFMDTQDYTVFLSYLKSYLLPKDSLNLQKMLADPLTPWRQKDRIIKLLRLNNFSETLELLAYCLMSNHFHFLFKQTEADTIDKFMNSLCTRYTMYFNKKYKRVGKLFQGVYKAVLVTSDEQLLHLSRYIHRNPTSLALQGDALQGYKYSSYQEYLGLRDTKWVKPDQILSFFSKSGYNSYKIFTEDVSLEEVSIGKVSKLTLDYES